MAVQQLTHDPFILHVALRRELVESFDNYPLSIPVIRSLEQIDLEPDGQSTFRSTDEEEVAAINDERKNRTPAHPHGTEIVRTTWELWIETGVVVVLAVLPPLYDAVASLILWDGSKHPFLDSQSYLTVWAMQTAVPVLYLTWRSGESWAKFGLSRPRIAKDGLAWLLIFLADVTAWSAAWFIIAQLLGDATVEALQNMSRNVFTAPAGVEYVLLPFSSSANGFAEELIMRGYLIPRFERLLGSSTKAVLVSMVLFASYHMYQGPAAVISIAVAGLVYGIAFCWLRRLWPIALAHATWNFFAAMAT
jgi:membrane protease YdiL (CAAX protease family)